MRRVLQCGVLLMLVGCDAILGLNETTLAPDASSGDSSTPASTGGDGSSADDGGTGASDGSGGSTGADSTVATGTGDGGSAHDATTTGAGDTGTTGDQDTGTASAQDTGTTVSPDTGGGGGGGDTGAGGTCTTCPGCALGSCLINLTDFESPISLQAPYVYFFDSDGNILRAPMGGGTVETLASTGAFGIQAIITSPENVYWNDGSAIYRMVLQGGTVMTAVSQQSTTAFAIDDTNLYWSNGPNMLSTPLGGGSVGTIVSGMSKVGTPYELAVDDTNVYWTDLGQDPNTDMGFVKSAPLSGGGVVTTLASLQKDPSGIRVQGPRVYWTNSGDGSTASVVSALLDGGSPITYASGLASAGDLAVDSANVYWAVDANQANGGGVYSAPLDGGTVTTVSAPLDAPESIQVDSMSIYWSTQYEGTGTVQHVQQLTPK